MLLAGLGGLACGLGLGSMCRVWVLVLVQVAAALGTMATIVAGQVTFAEGLGMMVMASLCCQLGYLVSAVAGMALRRPDPRRLDLPAR